MIKKKRHRKSVRKKPMKVRVVKKSSQVARIEVLVALARSSYKKWQKAKEELEELRAVVRVLQEQLRREDAPGEKPYFDSGDIKPESIVVPLPGEEELTEEEIQYWATPYFDELQAKKQAIAEHKKEEAE